MLLETGPLRYVVVKTSHPVNKQIKTHINDGVEKSIWKRFWLIQYKPTLMMMYYCGCSRRRHNKLNKKPTQRGSLSKYNAHTHTHTHIKIQNTIYRFRHKTHKLNTKSVRNSYFKPKIKSFSFLFTLDLFCWRLNEYYTDSIAEQLPLAKWKINQIA